MNFNATLLIQTASFILLGLFTMKFIWPPLIRAIEERQKKIADGLAAADKGEKALGEAKTAVDAIIKEARAQATKIVDQAGKRSNEMIEEAKASAVAEGQRLLGDAKTEVKMESNRARESLRKEVAALAVSGASKLLGREIDAKSHADLLDKLALDVERG
ncbi:MAG TPA: F0F1 ATP synthase subunit B [Steroidobacteraceae bacterium]|nr:F0F1 ATP synthase subunit B [Steroidobacteraceae bacterium]